MWSGILSDIESDILAGSTWLSIWHKFKHPYLASYLAFCLTASRSSPTHHHLYRWCVCQSQMGGLWLLSTTNHPPVITINTGGKNHSQIGGLYCFNHISPFWHPMSTTSFHHGIFKRVHSNWSLSLKWEMPTEPPKKPSINLHIIVHIYKCRCIFIYLSIYL